LAAALSSIGLDRTQLSPPLIKILEWFTHSLAWGNKMREPETLRAQAERLFAMALQVRDTDPAHTEKLIGEAIDLQEKATAMEKSAKVPPAPSRRRNSNSEC
jgi:hypothetical protein